MSDENNQNLSIKSLFQKIKSIFKEIGFDQTQIISMDITAGAYIVTNPSGDLPRVICSMDIQNNFKIEYSQFTESNKEKFIYFMNKVMEKSLSFTEGELIDGFTGTILADMTFDNKQNKELLDEILVQIEDNNEDLTSLKLFLTFKFSELAIIDPKAKAKANLKKEFERQANLDVMDETAIIIDFISKRTTKCIQSKHLRELYPKASKQECFKKLKGISEQGFLTQSGPWFLLNDNLPLR